MKNKDVLYVPGLKKNLLSISALEEKGFGTAFVDDQVLMWPKGKNVDDAAMIGVQDGGLYKLKGQAEQATIHSTMNPSKIWHRIFDHIHYKYFPIIINMVTCLPEIKSNHDGVCT